MSCRCESRRQQASIKYNEAVTACRELRAGIDCLRRERLVFDGLHSKLDKELAARAPTHFVCFGRTLLHLWMSVHVLQCPVLPLCRQRQHRTLSLSAQRMHSNAADGSRHRFVVRVTAVPVTHGGCKTQWQLLNGAMAAAGPEEGDGEDHNGGEQGARGAGGVPR